MDVRLFLAWHRHATRKGLEEEFRMMQACRIAQAEKKHYGPAAQRILTGIRNLEQGKTARERSNDFFSAFFGRFRKPKGEK